MIPGQDLEAWLIAIAQHTRETKEALEKGNAAKEKKDESWLDRLGKRIETGMQKGMATAVGQAKGLANSGMRGTVEQARYDYAMEQLGRQFAAVMSPVINAMTYGAAEIEKRMRGMGGSEQNRLMGNIIGGGLGLRYGGAFGGLAGAALGGAAFGDNRDLSTGGRLAAIGGGAFAGFRAAGPYGAAAGAIGSAVATSSDYERMREAGRGRFASMMVSAAAGMYELPHTLFGSGSAPLDSGRERWDRLHPRGGAAAPRRDVTPFQSEMGDAGSSYFRMQQAMIRTTAGAGFEESGPLKPLVDLLLQILDVLVRISGGAGPAPAPAPAGS